MIFELVSLLGTSVGGTLLGLLDNHLDSRRQKQIEERQIKRETQVLLKGDYAAYQKAIHKRQPDGSYSPMSYAICFVFIFMSVSYAACIGTLFFNDPNTIIYSKDPTNEPKQFEMLFGAIKYSWNDNRILQISRVGLGVIMLYPVIFVISNVITSEVFDNKR